MHFMAETHLAAAPTPEILALVPAEQARGVDLDTEGVRRNFFLAWDMSSVWQVFAVDSRTKLDSVLVSFPLHPYVTERVVQLGDA
jgi:muconolactone delta-isomerase